MWRAERIRAAGTWLPLRALQVGLLVSVLAYILVLFSMLTGYLGRALRRVYAQGWPITIVKAAILMLAYFALLQPVIGATVFLVLWRL